MSDPQAPTLGHRVHYTLTEADANAINDLGRQGARNRARAGQVLPAVVVATFDPSATTANLQVLLDGDGSYWATSRTEGNDPGHWTEERTSR